LPPLPRADLPMSLPFAYGGPALSGLLKSEPEDFEVDEQLGFAFDTGKVATLHIGIGGYLDGSGGDSF